MDDDRQGLSRQAGNKLSREQKAGFLFVIVIGFGALLLGGQYLWTQMASPFTINYTGPRLTTGAEAELAQISEQKNADTDLDEVNDYDEIYIYKTSPYLSDSDSDGLSDGSEINAGQDPNCATGQVCASTSSEDVDLPGNTAALDQQAAELAAQEQQLQQLMSELSSLPPSDIRQLLVDSGGDPAEVAKLTDEEVVTLYQQVLVQLKDSGELSKILEAQSSTPSEPTSP